MFLLLRVFRWSETSHVYYPAMSRLVREFCERHGYPYRSLGWDEALLKSLQVFLNPKPVVKELAKIDS